jgi:DNA-binding CsgD family transcriptional regulator
MSKKQATDLPAFDIRSTGLTLTAHERLQRAVAVLREYNSGLTAGAIAQKLSEHEHKPVNVARISAVLRWGYKKSVFRKVPHYKNDGSGIRHEPDDWFLKDSWERALQVPEESGSLFSKLTKKQCDLLDHVDWQSYDLRPGYALCVSVTIAVLSDSRGMATNEQIAAKLQVDESTLRNYVTVLRRLNVIPPTGPKLVDWGAIRELKTRRLLPGEVPITQRPWQPKYGLLSGDRSSGGAESELRFLLDAINWREVNHRYRRKIVRVKSQHEWLRITQILEAVGVERKIGADGLADELGVNEATVRIYLRKCRRLRLINVKPTFDNGPTGPRKILRVDVERLRNLAHVTAEASTNGHTTAVNSGAAGPPPEVVETKLEPPRKVRGRGGRPPDKWGHLTDWVAGHLKSHPEATAADVRRSYKSQFPDKPLPSPRTSTLRTIVGRCRPGASKSTR